MNDYIILYRKGFSSLDEFKIAKDIFKDKLVTQRAEISSNNTVIGRYSVLPFYKEVENDIKLQGSHLINSYNEHHYIANFDYYYDIQEYTFKSYKDYEFQYAPEGKYVIKGVTNSLKHKWASHMFANSKSDALCVMANVKGDSLISQQDLIIREYKPLYSICNVIGYPPISNEWRVFILNGSVMCYDFYWGIIDLEEDVYNKLKKSFMKKGYSLLLEVIKKIKIPFYVIDLAELEDGNWIVVELNDGQMSGLSTIDTTNFYKSLKLILENNQNHKESIKC